MPTTVILVVGSNNASITSKVLCVPHINLLATLQHR